MIIPNFPATLLDLHHHWHNPVAHTGAGTGRQHPMGTPGAGLEFLTFHRDFMAQVFNWMAGQAFNPPLDVAAWNTLPPELQTQPAGWSSMLDMQLMRITSNSPAFTSADDLGTFIEIGIHSWIHGACATIYHEPEVGTLHSPLSTIFYKIHGLVDHWWREWERQQKNWVKDVIDVGPKSKEIVPDKNLKELVKEKEFVKEHISEKPVKDVPDKLAKENVPEKPIKEKDKDMFEGGPNWPGGDPMGIITNLHQRLTDLENRVGTGRAFIESEERPEVGTLRSALLKSDVMSTRKLFDPTWDEENGNGGNEGEEGKKRRGRRSGSNS